jgi:beta-N-acetylhexosaminidase
VVAVTHSRGAPAPALSDALRELHRAADGRMILVATGTPYDLLACPDADAFVATYGQEPVTIAAAARALAGVLTPTGRLPVSLPGLYAAGHRESTASSLP